MKKQKIFISTKKSVILSILFVLILVFFVISMALFQQWLMHPMNTLVYVVIYFGVALIGFIVITISLNAEIKFYEKSEEAMETYDKLKNYLCHYSSSALVIDIGENSYNASSLLGKNIIKLSGKWFDEAINDVDNKIVEYIKCTILHEIYHLRRNEPTLKLFICNILILICPLKKIRKRITIINWSEELSADRFAFDIYNDKETFETCLNYKKKKWKSTSSSFSHPSWEIRYEFIHKNIPVEYKEVEKRYDKWIKKEIE